MIEITQFSSEDSDFYEFNGNFPIFVVANFTADSLSREAGFSLTYLKADKYDPSAVTEESIVLFTDTTISIAIIVVLFTFMIVIAVVLSSLHRTAIRVEPAKSEVKDVSSRITPEPNTPKRTTRSPKKRVVKAHLNDGNGRVIIMKNGFVTNYESTESIEVKEISKEFDLQAGGASPLPTIID